MTAGLPGVGIGGLFYLASALLMPFRSLVATATGREARWPVALRQALIALATIATVWATLQAIGWLIAAISPSLVAGALPGAAGSETMRNALRTAALLGSIGTLTLVLAAVQTLRLLLPPRSTPRAAPFASAAETQSAA
jgi:hypothetical protein